jgi:hypothetical protein
MFTSLELISNYILLYQTALSIIPVKLQSTYTFFCRPVVYCFHCITSSIIKVYSIIFKVSKIYSNLNDAQRAAYKTFISKAAMQRVSATHTSRSPDIPDSNCPGKSTCIFIPCLKGN